MPSFATESPLDYKIKKGVIYDTINLLNLSLKRKHRLKNIKKAEMQKRLLKPVNINTKVLAKNKEDSNKKKNDDGKTNEDLAQQALMDKAAWKQHLKAEKVEKA